MLQKNNISSIELRSGSRRRDVVQGRAAISWIAVRELGYSGADYPIETCIQKILAAGAPVNYTQIGLNFQFHRKRLALTTKPALVIQVDTVCVNRSVNMLGCN